MVEIINPQETQQVAPCDGKLVPSADIVKIGSTNIRLETTYTIKKIQDTDSYELLLANKKYTINVKVFRTILNICPRVEGEDFTDVPDDETALTFLIDLGYKGPLNRIGEDYQEYTHPIPDVMLTDAINHSESYQMFIKYSTHHNPPMKSKGKCSKGKKTTEESQEAVDVPEESEPKPEPAKKKTTSRRIVKKKVTLSIDDNIIFDDPDAALELAKSFKSVEIQDTPCSPKSIPATSKTKLKGTGSIPDVPDESTVVSTTSSEGTSAKPGVFDEDMDITKEKVILEWGDEQDNAFSNNDNDDDEKDDMDGYVDDVTPPKYDTQQNTTFGVLLHDTITQVITKN
nr:hypothetical protein [Tanacetum cinerariifolium]